MAPPNPVSLYSLYAGPGNSVYNAQGTLIGTTTAYKAIAHDGKSIGSIEIDTTNQELGGSGKKAWISGYGTKNQNGIQWTQFGSEGREYFLTIGVAFKE